MSPNAHHQCRRPSWAFTSTFSQRQPVDNNETPAVNPAQAATRNKPDVTARKTAMATASAASDRQSEVAVATATPTTAVTAAPRAPVDAADTANSSVSLIVTSVEDAGASTGTADTKNGERAVVDSVQRRDGWAPIKAEYIRPRETQEAVGVSTAAEGAPSADFTTTNGDGSAGSSIHKKRGRGRNNKRPKDDRPAQGGVLCPHVANGTTCGFGERCRFNHDAKAYVESKGPDIADHCPIWDAIGSCPNGLRCRFGSTHTDPVTLKPIVRPGAPDPSSFDTINGLTRDLQTKLRRNQVSFACDRKGWKAFLLSLDADYPPSSAATDTAAHDDSTAEIGGLPPDNKDKSAEETHVASENAGDKIELDISGENTPADDNGTVQPREYGSTLEADGTRQATTALGKPSSSPDQNVTANVDDTADAPTQNGTDNAGFEKNDDPKEPPTKRARLMDESGVKMPPGTPLAANAEHATTAHVSAVSLDSMSGGENTDVVGAASTDEAITDRRMDALSPSLPRALGHEPGTSAEVVEAAGVAEGDAGKTGGERKPMVVGVDDVDATVVAGGDGKKFADKLVSNGVGGSVVEPGSKVGWGGLHQSGCGGDGDWAQASLAGEEPRHSRKVDFEGKVYVAPLTTVGNLPFRRLVKDFGADITCGEMSLAHHLLKGQGSEWALLRRHPCEDIFGVQVAGAHPDQMTRVAELLEKHVKMDFVDINMGCPIDLVCDKGMGAALMGRGRKLRGIIAGMTSQLSCPLTIKMRVGWDEKKPNADSVVRIAQREAERCRSRGFPGSVAYVMVHGRSRLQRYSKLADWDYIRKVAGSQDPGFKPLPVIGNGDILSWRDHEERLEQARAMDLSGDLGEGSGKRWSTCCMLGRGALIKPWLPTEVKEKRDWDISSSERLDIYRGFVRYGLEHWGSDQMGVNKTRRFLLEWLSFTHRYIPVGLLEVLPQRINERPLPYYGRNELEGLMCSQNAQDWVKISEMLLGPVPADFEFEPKHKANSYAPLAATS